MGKSKKKGKAKTKDKTKNKNNIAARTYKDSKTGKKYTAT